MSYNAPSGVAMNQELQIRIAPITSRLWMLGAKPSVPQTQDQGQPARPVTAKARRRPGQLIRTAA
jgi:hypothetical protein